MSRSLLTAGSLLCCSIGLVPSLQAAEEAGSIVDALKEGTVTADLRLRYEGVDQDVTAGSDLDATAITLRTLFGYETATYNGWGITLTFENNSAVFSTEEYNSTINGETDNAVVADPEYTEIDQIFVSYGGFEDNTIKLGKQVINHGNQRHVGAVGWRQNRQTFDAARIISKSVENLTIDYSFVLNANRIFSNLSAAGNAEQFSHFLHASYKIEDVGTAAGYVYLLDFDSPGNEGEGSDSSTIGVRFDGSTPLGEGMKLKYEAELATQSDYADRTASFTATYMHLCGGVVMNGIEVALGYEVLGSDDGDVAFATPHATLHKFNGWADKFLGTPTDGLEDMYLRVGGKIPGVEGLTAKAMYHVFSGDDSGDDFGNELDLVATYKVKSVEKMTVGFKAAMYAEDGLLTDTTKYWLWTSWGF